MLTLIVSALLLSIISHVESSYISDYNYHSEAGGWLKMHKVPATWTEAFLQCHNEGAVLASPLTRELRQAMQLHIDNNDNSLSYYIGANSKFTPGQYVSIEGVPLANMPIADMYQLLDTEHGECLTTEGYNISAVSCSKRLPYFCYTKADGRKLTECGTFDIEYKLEAKTGSCYKVHRVHRTWLAANSMCISEGGHLAIVNNDEEASIISKKIPDVKIPWANPQWEPIYIGLQDWTGKGTWLTNHGDSLDQVFNGWAENQPSNSTQLCGAVIRPGKLDNIWCDGYDASFICEKDPMNIRYSTEQQLGQTEG